MKKNNNFLTNYKEEIVAIGYVFTSLGVLMALGFSVYSLVPKPKKPVIDILATRIDNNRERLVIYNGGDGPCVEMHIRYKDRFSDVRQIVNYDISWHVNAKPTEDGKKLFFPSRIFSQIGTCDNNNCHIDAGVLKPNMIFAMEFTKNMNSESENILVTCINIEKKIQIFRK